MPALDENEDWWVDAVSEATDRQRQRLESDLRVQLHAANAQHHSAALIQRGYHRMTTRRLLRSVRQAATTKAEASEAKESGRQADTGAWATTWADRCATYALPIHARTRRRLRKIWQRSEPHPQW